jgi:hypothetical protein
MNKVLKSIKHDLAVAMKIEIELRKEGKTSGDQFDNAIAHKTVSRAIISMIPELNKKPEQATDEDIFRLLKKYVSNERERQLYIQKYLTESDVEGISASELKKLVNEKIKKVGSEIDTLNIIIAENYLPKGPSEEEIINFIKENIDLSQFKNKMQAMGSIMKNFPGCDGNFVKDILLKYKGD